MIDTMFTFLMCSQFTPVGIGFGAAGMVALELWAVAFENTDSHVHTDIYCLFKRAKQCGVIM
jgi:hypothetical protein